MARSERVLLSLPCDKRTIRFTLSIDKVNSMLETRNAETSQQNKKTPAHLIRHTHNSCTSSMSYASHVIYLSQTFLISSVSTSRHGMPRSMRPDKDHADTNNSAQQAELLNQAQAANTKRVRQSGLDFFNVLRKRRLGVVRRVVRSSSRLNLEGFRDVRLEFVQRHDRIGGTF